jgi:hypothetical protein
MIIKKHPDNNAEESAYFRHFRFLPKSIVTGKTREHLRDAKIFPQTNISNNFKLIYQVKQVKSGKIISFWVRRSAYCVLNKTKYLGILTENSVRSTRHDVEL